MRFLLFVFLIPTFAFAFDCRQEIQKHYPDLTDEKIEQLYSCDSLSGESSRVTSEGRLIFISPYLCIAKVQSPARVVTVMQFHAAQYTNFNENAVRLKLEKTERVYPSGNVIKSYTYFEKLRLENGEAKVTHGNSFSFGREEVKYQEKYRCL